VTNGTYLVDPVQGSDTAGDGSGTSGGKSAPGCAFKTITKALAVIGASPAAGTKIHVVGPSTVQVGETFPLVVPGNVTLSGITGAVTVLVTGTSADGFHLKAPSSGLANLVVDGTGNTATARGIVVGAGSDATTTITGVEVKSFTTEAGVRVQDTGVVTIGAGTSVHGSGSASAKRAGLHVTGSGSAIITGAAGSTIAFYENSFAGISVDGSAKVTITGTPGTGEAGTVVTYSNTGPGLAVAGAVNVGVYPPKSTVTGLVSYSNGGDGAKLLAGSNVQVRGSAFYGNLVGVGVASAGSAALAYNDDVSHIDLGTDPASDPGGNTLQAPTTTATLVNTNAGLCFGISANKSQTLAAAGNTWATAAGTASLTCTGASPGSLSKSATCAGGNDVAGGGQTGNTVTIASCN
jgi:hypothetical protein